MRTRRLSLAITLGEVTPPTPPGPTPAEQHDRAQLIVALQAAHARDHELVGHIQQLKAALEQQNETLRSRTIERDHFQQDGHLWALCLAYLVKQEVDEELALPADDVNAMEGLMLSANVVDGMVRMTVNPRPAPSAEGTAGG